MNIPVTTVVAVLIIAFMAGCGTRQERCAAAFGAMQRKSLADYKEANDPAAAIAVLEAYLANVDWSEKNGLKATSAPELRFWAEARLPELYEIMGNSENAKGYMILAVQHSKNTLEAMQHSVITNEITAADVQQAVMRWDEKIKPKWRRKAGANQASHAIGAETAPQHERRRWNQKMVRDQ